MARYGFFMLFIVCGLFASGCHRATSQVAAPEPPAIPVSTPVSREVTDYVDFTGRVDAMQAVDVRARVSGYLTQMPFKEGSEVKKGDLLFEVDPRPYRAQSDQAQSQVGLSDARLKLAIANYERAKEVAKTPGAITQQLLETYMAQQAEAEASLNATKASLAVFELNHSFTKVTAPIDGEVSRYYLTVGNLVNQDQTLLTTIVSLDPMYAYFDMDETTLLKIRRAVNEGKIQRLQSGEVPILMELQGEEDFPHQGKVDFVNNQVSPTTGSISVRGVFPNPRPEKGDRLLSPGLFVRIRLPIGAPHAALLVIDRAIATDQGLKYVYVLDADNKAQYRRITTGPLQPDGLRVVDGLKKDDRVVIGGQQQVRPKMEIRPDVTPMPTIGPEPSSTAKSE